MGMTTETPPETPPIPDEEHERIFEVEEIRIPLKCDRCKMKRPKSVMIRRVFGRSTSAALCLTCAVTFKRQAQEVAQKIRTDLEARGATVSNEH